MIGITVFDPREKGEKTYKDKYPELLRIEEFRRINSRDLEIIWYYANRTSPLVQVGMGDFERIEKALEYADPEKKTAKLRRKEMLDLDFSSDFLRAIERMSKVNPEARYSGYEMIDNFMQSFTDISKLKPSDFKNASKEIDYEKYAKTASTIAQQLSSMIKMSEEGFGITKKVDSIEEESLIDKYHSDKQA